MVDQRIKNQILELIEAIEEGQGHHDPDAECPYCMGELLDDLPIAEIKAFLRKPEPKRDHEKSCVAGSFGTSIMLRDGTKVCLVRGEGAEAAHVWLEVRDAEKVTAQQ